MKKKRSWPDHVEISADTNRPYVSLQHIIKSEQFRKIMAYYKINESETEVSTSQKSSEG